MNIFKQNEKIFSTNCSMSSESKCMIFGYTDCKKSKFRSCREPNIYAGRKCFGLFKRLLSHFKNFNFSQGANFISPQSIRQMYLGEMLISSNLFKSFWFEFYSHLTSYEESIIWVNMKLRIHRKLQGNTLDLYLFPSK